MVREELNDDMGDGERPPLLAVRGPTGCAQKPLHVRADTPELGVFTVGVVAIARVHEHPIAMALCVVRRCRFRRRRALTQSAADQSISRSINRSIDQSVGRSVIHQRVERAHERISSFQAHPTNNNNNNNNSSSSNESVSTALPPDPRRPSRSQSPSALASH